MEHYQIKCKEHGLQVIDNPLIEKGKNISRMLRQNIYELNKVLPNKYTAEYFRVSQDTVRNIDKEMITYYKSLRNLSPKAIGLDEMSIGNGHNNYIHILSDIQNREVIDIGEGRKESNVNKTMEKNKRTFKKVKYGVIDMWEGFKNSLEKFIPGLMIIYDKFHIVKHLNEAIDNIRKNVYRDSRGKSAEVIKGQKYILLSKRENLNAKKEKRLKELMKLNEPLYQAYLLKENFFQLWSYKTMGWAKRFFERWKSQLQDIPHLKPLKKFAEMIERKEEGVFNYFKVKGSISLGYVEGTNNKARHLINRGYGYRDREYLYLKIIQQCSQSLSKFNRNNLKFIDSS